jgi:spermidine synthase
MHLAIIALPVCRNTEDLVFMKPRIKLAEATSPDGGAMALYEHDGAYSISFSGQELMHSKASASETLLGQLSVERIKKGKPARVVIGGLGLGFTLRSVLEASSADASVEMVELIPKVIEWNRQFLRDLNGSCLDDPRVTVRVEDVNDVIRSAAPGSCDAIILDVDNGPVAMVANDNASLYSRSGIRAIHSALKRGGRAVFWSAGPDVKFEAKLEKAGFKVGVVRAKVHQNAKRAAYFLYIANRINHG